MRVLTPGLVGLMFLCACSNTPSDRGDHDDATPTSDSGTHDGVSLDHPGPTPDATGSDGSTTDGAVSDGSTADGPVSPPGFTAEPGFTVTGSLVHGGSVTIKRTAGGLGSRPHPLPLRVGGGAYAFSFHTPQLTTGRDAVRAGSSVHQGGPWVSVVEPSGNRSASDTER